MGYPANTVSCTPFQFDLNLNNFSVRCFISTLRTGHKSEKESEGLVQFLSWRQKEGTNMYESKKEGEIPGRIEHGKSHLHQNLCINYTPPPHTHTNPLHAFPTNNWPVPKTSLHIACLQAGNCKPWAIKPSAIEFAVVILGRATEGGEGEERGKGPPAT